MMAGAGMKLMVLMLLGHFGLIAGKFSDGGWSWNEAEGLDALGAFLA